MNKMRSQVRVAERGERKVRVATWNFCGICSQCKQKEVAGVLVKNSIDVCRPGVMGKGGIQIFCRWVQMVREA